MVENINVRVGSSHVSNVSVGFGTEVIPLDDFEGQNVDEKEIGRIPCQKCPSIERNELLKVQVLLGDGIEGKGRGVEEGRRGGG